MYVHIVMLLLKNAENLINMLKVKSVILQPLFVNGRLHGFAMSTS